MAEKLSESHQQLNFIETLSENGEKVRHYNVFLPYLPEEYKLIAEKELDETEENKVNGIKALKEFLKKKCITCPDDNELIAILRWSKYNIKKAEEKILKYLETRNLTLEKLKAVDDRKLKAILKDLVFSVLPYTAQDGSMILCLRPNLDLEIYNCDDIASSLGACFIYLCSYPIPKITGLSVLLECEASLSLLYPLVKAYIRYTKHVFNFPIRIKRMDFVNENVLVRWCYNILRPLFPAKLVKRNFFHGKGYDSLVKQYHPDILPREFGGTLDMLNNKHFIERFLPFFQEFKRKTPI